MVHLKSRTLSILHLRPIQNDYTQCLNVNNHSIGVFPCQRHLWNGASSDNLNKYMCPPYECSILEQFWGKNVVNNIWPAKSVNQANNSTSYNQLLDR